MIYNLWNGYAETTRKVFLKGPSKYNEISAMLTPPESQRGRWLEIKEKGPKLFLHLNVKEAMCSTSAPIRR